MGLSLNSIIVSGLLMAIILPFIGMVGATLPNSGMSAEFNHTSTQIINDFNTTFGGIYKTAVGNTTNNQTSGSLFANVAQFSAYAFIVPNFGSIILDLYQVPYLDILSLNLLVSAISSSLPGFPSFFLSLGVSLLATYMFLVILIQGISMVLKYNLLAAGTSG